MKKAGQIIIGVLVVLFLLSAAVGLIGLTTDFNFEEIHIHVAVKDKAVSATCTTSGLTEGEHCTDCNEIIKAQEVVPSLGHAYDDEGKCTRCGTVRALTYARNADGTYTVMSIGDIVSRVVVIPSEYNGVAVTGIAANAFEGTRFMHAVAIPASITRIGAYAFKGCDNLDTIYCEVTMDESSALEWNSKWHSQTGNPYYQISYGLGVNWEYNSAGEPKEIEEGVDLPIMPLYETKGIYSGEWNFI